MFFTPEDNAVVDEIFALELSISNPVKGEDAILLSLVTQPALVRRAFYLSASAAFRESYLEDLKSYDAANMNVMPRVYHFLSNPAHSATPDTEEIVAMEFEGAETVLDRFPLFRKTIPPLREADATPPARSMELRLRLSLPGYSEKTREELKKSLAALKAEGVTPLMRQADIIAQLEGYRNAAVAESVRQEAMLDLAYGDEESFCGGEL